MKHKHDKKDKVIKQEAAQAGRFGLVGILNTLVDIVLYNVLIMLFLIPAGAAGVVSGTVAMVNSFIFNQRFTFRVQKVSRARIITFFAITGFGIYVIRPIVLTFFTKTWLWPSQIVYDVTSFLRLPFSAEFDRDNFALAVAILLVLTYNYITYKKFVFTKS
ncbi:GtrA family protein [bacterium]|nr:GtrA family protein [bacterium]